MSWERMDLKRADYTYWNQVVFVTLNEFIYLAAGYEPLPAGGHGTAFLNLSNNEFKEFYKKIKRIGDELPIKSTVETEVKDYLTPEPKYEAVFLINWIKSKNIRVNVSYVPIESKERQKRQLIDELTGRPILPFDKLAKLLALCNPNKSEKHFKTALFEAVQSHILQPVPETWNYTIPAEERNFKLTTDAFAKFVLRMKWSFPQEIFELTNETSDKKLSGTPSDNIHPKKLRSIHIMLLTMAVTKYGYDPKNDKNSATGGKAGSIKSDVQALGEKLGLHELHLDIKEDTVKSLLDEAVDALLQ
ncbi:hypothetical protein ACVSNX_04775 [Legionella pneumophila]|nr:hypothetical protein [Legionella pneumophila]